MEAKIQIKKTSKIGLFCGSSQGPQFFCSAVLFLMFMLFSGQAFAKTIDIDGSFSDWEGVPEVVSGNLGTYPFAGTTYYFNLASDTWQITDPGYPTCMFNETNVLQVADLSLTNDNNYLFMKLRQVGSFSKYFWLNGSEIEQEDYLNEPASGSNSNPCAGHIVTTPADFRHDMVFGFDKDRDGQFDFYLAYEITYSKGAYVDERIGFTDKNFYILRTHILKDDGDGIYTEDSDETLLASVGSGEYKISHSAVSDSGGVLQESRVDLGKLLENTGMKIDNLYDVRYSSHSKSSIATATGGYIFEKTDPVKLKAKLSRKIKKSKFWVRGKTAPKTNLLLLVDGEENSSLKSGANGRFSKRVEIGFGSHDVKLVASNKAKGTNNLSGKVVRKITRAVDMPFELGIIHSKNETKDEILEIWGEAFGVSEVQVAVDDFEWGWAVVKKTSGKYKMKVRLVKGLNTVKVTGYKDDEYVTVTKVVEKN